MDDDNVAGLAAGLVALLLLLIAINAHPALPIAIGTVERLWTERGGDYVAVQLPSGALQAFEVMEPTDYGILTVGQMCGFFGVNPVIDKVNCTDYGR